MMIFSLVAMIGLEKRCITSACLQWLCHSGERTVARGPVVFYLSPTGSISLSYVRKNKSLGYKSIKDSHQPDKAHVGYTQPASVAQLDAPSNWRTGGRSFNPLPRSATFFRRD